MESISLIGRKTYKYDNNITIVIPTIKQIRGIDEDMSTDIFWREVNLFSETPTDNIAQLDIIGIDFTQVSEYMFFVLNFQQEKFNYFKSDKKSQLFKGLDFWNLNVTIGDNGIITLNNGDSVIIDKQKYKELSDVICYMTCREKTKPKKFGNEYAKKKRIEIERKKYENLKNNPPKKDSNVFDKLILRLVCNANFPYDFTTVNNISLFEFMYSLKQVDKDISVNDIMKSRFYGADMSKISAKDLSRYVI